VRRVVYDCAVLIAAERNDRRVWAEHRVRLEAGMPPLVPAVVVARASRSPKQVQLRRLLRGCELVSFHEADAHRAGALLARARTDDIVDAAVADVAIRRDADVMTSDADDIARLLGAARVERSVLPV
jgi:predicted nucleic acid-binding protein